VDGRTSLDQRPSQGVFRHSRRRAVAAASEVTSYSLPTSQDPKVPSALVAHIKPTRRPHNNCRTGPGPPLAPTDPAE
jgi:hypothetical protein